MRKITAFFTALVLFIGIVLGMHFVTKGSLDVNNTKFGTWTEEEKFVSRDAIAANMDKNTLLVMGSSELKHGQGTPFHPESIFEGQKTNLMLVGAGYYQSLFHATALAALAPDMQNKKVVLLLAPQWFRKNGVLPKAYSSRFSEMNYVAMMKNPDISNKTKEYITKRSEELLSVDEPTKERVQRYEKLYLKQEGSWMDKLYASTYGCFLKEKSQVSLTGKMKLSGITKQMENQTSGENTSIAFDKLRAAAEEAGKKAVTNNPFYVTDRYYTKNLEPKLEEEKNVGVKTGYSESPEYDDLKCFLDVCKEVGITPLLVKMPVNGFWYDYTGFNKEKRQEYYDNIQEIADAYDAQVADFSDREYEPYFMEDTIHLGWKGWVDTSEAIYNFAGETK